MRTHESSSRVTEDWSAGVGATTTGRRLQDLVLRTSAEFEGAIAFDTSKPDGTPPKLVDVSRLRARGWRARISLREGVASTYEAYVRDSAPDNSTDLIPIYSLSDRSPSISAHS